MKPIDRAVARAVAWHGDAQERTWRAAFVAHAIVGRYDDSVRTLARACARDVDAVYRWARGAVTLLALYHYFCDDKEIRRRLRQIRHTLSVSHLDVAGQQWRRLELDPLAVFAALDTAAEAGASVRQLAGYLKVDGNDDDDAPPPAAGVLLPVWDVSDAAFQDYLARVPGARAVLVDAVVPEDARQVRVVWE